MIDVELSEVLAELDEVGQALFDAATRRAIARKQTAVHAQQQNRVAELEEQVRSLTVDAATPQEVPSRV
jgi:hypothetical protein